MDLSNTYCIVSEETYKALEELGYEPISSSWAVIKNSEEYEKDDIFKIGEDGTFLWDSHSEIGKNEKIILKDGVFIYETAQDNFSKFGFKPNPNVELFFKDEETKRIHGLITDEKGIKKARSWPESGNTGMHEMYDLELIEMPWYEDANNFPALITNGDGALVVYHYNSENGCVYDYHSNKHNITDTSNWVLADEDVLNSLRIK